MALTINHLYTSTKWRRFPIFADSLHNPQEITFLQKSNYSSSSRQKIKNTQSHILVLHKDQEDIYPRMATLSGLFIVRWVRYKRLN